MFILQFLDVGVSDVVLCIVKIIIECLLFFLSFSLYIIIIYLLKRVAYNGLDILEYTTKPDWYRADIKS